MSETGTIQQAETLVVREPEELKLVRDVEKDNIVFHIDGKELVRMNTEGFFIEGRKVTDDTEVYEGFKHFITLWKERL